MSRSIYHSKRRLDIRERLMPVGYAWGGLPKIIHRDEFVGKTGYIDQIQRRHLSYRVSRGLDQYNRQYLVILHNDNVQCIFQRYTNEVGGIWTWGGHCVPKPADALLKDTGNRNLQECGEDIRRVRSALAVLLPNNRIQTQCK